MSIDIERVRLIKEWEVHKPKISPIIFTSIDGNVVAVKDESVHPTGTYKALHGWMLGMHYLQNNFPNPFNYYLTSTGNAVMADFYYTKLLNRLINQRVNSSFDPLRTFSFFPAEYKDKLFGPDSNGKFLHGKDLIKFLECMQMEERLMKVYFNSKYWFDTEEKKPCLEYLMDRYESVNADNSLDVTEGFNPTYSNVMKQYVLQLQEHFGKIPKTLMVIQFGAGILYYDCKNYVKEHDLPIDFLAVSTGNPETIADKIHDSTQTWQHDVDFLRREGSTTAKKDGSLIYHVSDQEILYAMSELNQNCISSGPSGASGIAALPKLIKRGYNGYELFAFINTGNEINYVLENLN